MQGYVRQTDSWKKNSTCKMKKEKNEITRTDMKQHTYALQYDFSRQPFICGVEEGRGEEKMEGCGVEKRMAN